MPETRDFGAFSVSWRQFPPPPSPLPPAGQVTHTRSLHPLPHPGRPPHLRAARRLAAPLPACVRGSRTESGASERQQRNDSEAGLEEPVSAEEAWGNLTGSGKSEGRGDRRSLQGEACTAAGAQSGPGAVAASVCLLHAHEKPGGWDPDALKS